MSIMGPLRQLLRNIRGQRPDNTASCALEALRGYVAAARRLGLDRPHLFLSFDCDTDLDADAVEAVHAFLASRNLKATYAVPGAQLLKSPEPYRRLAERGAEFMNHGALPHAEWRGDQWVGITFYNEMTPEAVETDIRRGHDIVTDVAGRAPLGFRAPHFGCYQEPEQVDRLHRIAAALGYRYCSTTIPAFGLRFGPMYETHGLIELPCFGSIRNPETILDSWTYLTDRKHYALGEQYYDLMAETVQVVIEQSLPAVFTWYADPCHVLDQRPFLRAMELLSKSGVVSVSGSELPTLVSAGT